MQWKSNKSQKYKFCNDEMEYGAHKTIILYERQKGSDSCLGVENSLAG